VIAQISTVFEGYELLLCAALALVRAGIVTLGLFGKSVICIARTDTDLVGVLPGGTWLHDTLHRNTR
jgi:hypothetical protein